MFAKKIDTQLLFVHEFLTFVKSGVALVEALDFLKAQSSLPAKMRGEVANVHNDVKRGETLTDSLRKRISFLESWQFDLIEASEKSGTITDGLLFIRSILEKKKENNKKMFYACLHPAFYTVLFVFIYPLRELMGMLLHRNSVYVSAYLMAEAKIFIVLASFFFFFTFMPIVFRSMGIKRVIDAFVLFIPLFGKTIKKMFFYQFFYVFGACYTTGCSVLQSWKLASQMCDNEAIRAKMKKGENILKANGDLDTAFFVTKLFPEKIVNLIRVGLKSGTMKDQTAQCMNIYYEQYEFQAKKMEMVIPKLFYLIIVILLIGIIIKLTKGYMNTVFNLVPIDQAL